MAARRRRRAAPAILGHVLTAGFAVFPAWASTVHIGEHAGFGRVTFSAPVGARETATQEGDRLIVRLPGAGAIAGLAKGPSNVGRIDGGQNQAELHLAPGSHWRLWRGGGQLGVDVYPADGPGSSVVANQLISKPAATPFKVAVGVPDITLVPIGPPPVPAKPPSQKGDIVEAPVAKPASPVPSPSAAAQEAAPQDGLAAERLPDEAHGEASILVPFDRLVGAAAFPRGGVGHVVFDSSKPIDLAALKDDKVFGAARVRLLPAATHFSMPLAQGARLRLQRKPEGWVVTVAQAGAAEPSAKLSLEKGAVNVAMPFAADTVVMDDAATGGRVLIGTVLGNGPGVAVAHVSPEFSLLPSWAGVAVAAASDRLMLRAGKGAFSLSNSTSPVLAAQLADATGSAAEAAALTRHFDLPPLPTPALLMRLRANLHAAGSAPKMGRLAQRIRAAQAMLALGLDREAAGLMRAAQQDDPAQGGSADAAALLAMANWLAGGDAGNALADAGLGKSDEITMWRALTQPVTEDKRTASAASLAATWRLLLAYPEPLQRRLVRPAADTMLQGGQLNAADAILARFSDHALDDLRAAALVQHGRVIEALVLLDRVSSQVDRKQAAAAAHAALEMRLAAHQITPAQAAAGLEKRLYAWRDDAMEISQRLRIAALRTQAGEWRQALTLLRETDGLFPEAHDSVRSAELAVIADLLRAGQAQRLPPLDLVALVQESADLLAAKDASTTLAPVLVDKLLALDLPDRAEPIVAHMMAATDSPGAKAGLGAKLATLRLDSARPAEAIAALDASESAGLPAPLASSRVVLRARALAASGQTEKALTLLAGETNPEALDVQARLLEDRKDWRGAEAALATLARASLPATGRLTVTQQDLLLRLASAASEAGDIAALQQMQSERGSRMDAGPRSALFQALVQQPVRSLTDLPRSGREADAARAVPAALTRFDGR
jgi:hypothetical protein